MDVLRDFWSQRSPNERRLLGAGAAVLLLTLFYVMLIEPAASGIPRLEKGLPATRTQAVRLEQMLNEVTALKARPQVAMLPATEARSALEKSLATAGLKAERIVQVADGDLQLTFANVPYATWSTWLAAAERELGAKAGTVSARATSTPGAADINLTLRLARR